MSTPKKTPYILLLITMILALFALNGCSSDDDPGTPAGGNNAPLFAVGGNEQVELPAALEASNDPQADMVVGFMAQVNGLAAMNSLMAIPPGAVQTGNKDNSWEYTWSINEPPTVATITYTIREFDDHYTWTMVIDGTDGEYTYDNVVLYFAEAAIDESWGSFTFYDPDYPGGDVLFSWNWATNDLGAFSMTMVDNDEDEGYRIDFVVNPDGSGTLDIFENVGGSWQIALHFEWDAIGNGSWIIYSGGMVEDSGSWSNGDR